MNVFLVDRRDFLRLGLAAGTGLVLGVRLAGAADDAAPAAVTPDVFVRIGEDDTVTVIVKHIEFGQGTFTGLPTVVAEELDCDWSRVRAVGAPADPARYANLNWGGAQGTGGSSSMNNAYTQMRRAGATARAMLVAAAARAWQVRPGEITVHRGVLRHAASGREARFGEFAAAARAEAVPKNVALKDPADFVYIGHDLPRLDIPAKSDGSAVYTQDFRLPGMLTALVAHPRRFGAGVARVDDAAARAVDGVVEVLTLPSGVAVVARDFWTARKGREALAVEWDETKACRRSSDDILDQYRTLAAQPGLVARADGDAAGALAAAATTLDADYEFPYLAHAAMEPMNAVARFENGALEMWYGVQGQSLDLGNLSRALDIAPERITLNMLYAGGSFGRRSHFASDYAVEAARIAQALPGRAVKLVWTREDDLRAGAYRPLNLHRVRGGLDTAGNVLAWHHRIVGQSIRAGLPKPPPADQVDHTCVEGASNFTYAIPHVRVESHQPTLDIPVLWWRSVGHTHTAFAVETFLDELAHAAGRDPLALRRELLTDDPRRRAVLDLAAEKAGWGEALPAGRGRGLAVHHSFKTWVAEVAEVTVADDGSFQVDRVVVAVDCGVAINPSIVRAQMQGGVGYALSALLGEAVTLVDGVAQQDNFDTYPLLRCSQMPEVEVHIVPSREHPSGVGEPAVPPLAPAVGNAIFAATGKRLRRLPFTTAA
ncbi:MAG: xanthine dehydrogenase family protein molybdopterin-binding subunit [Gammaproteobacteria bacterium]|nr:xanthine dehydrogenase family protein molybdopterin-binding subunit [Gammaproteobacteria bacterium]